jgi:dTDP-glucose pyrophosphorylase
MLPLNEVDLTSIAIPISEQLRAAIVAIDRNQRGIALIIDSDRRLVGTVTDGDVRRAMLAGKGLDTPLADLLAEKASSPYPQPVTAPMGTEASVLLQIMRDKVIRQIPLVDDEGRAGGLITLDDLVPDQPLGIQAVIMAGGFGSRLMPLTEEMPKPMLTVGDKPLMEIIIGQLRQAGIRKVNITTHYQRDKIKSHFGDGHNHGVEVNYVDEECPLGTAGALGLMSLPKEPVLVMNGDILTDVDFRAMLDFHRDHRAEMTVAVRKYEVEVPYGVVECETVNVRSLTEKPRFSFFVNAGIYLLEPTVHRLIPTGVSSNMTDLIQRMLDAGRPVVSFPVREYWLDIGRLSDYELAQAYANGNQKAVRPQNLWVEDP